MSDFRVQGEVALDGSKFIGGLKQVEIAANRTGANMVNSLGNHLAGLFSLGAIGSFIGKTVEMAGKLEDMSARTGASVEELQRMDRAMKDNGGTLEELIGFWEKLNVARADALSNPSGSQAQAFKTFGVSQQQLKSQNAPDITRTIATALQNSTNVEALITPLREVGGRGSGAMIAAFRSGLDQMYQDITVMTSNTTQQIDEVTDRWDNMMKDLMSTIAPLGVKALSMWERTQMALTAKMTQVMVESYSGSKEKGQEALAISVKEDVEKIRSDQKAREDKASARKGPLDFTSLEKEPAAMRSLGPIKSDALLAVGNFLGASKSSVNNYAAQAVEQAKITNQRLLELKEEIKNMNSDLGFA